MATVYVIALFMSAMDNHIVNIMLPTLARDFHTSLLGVQWTRISYVLSLAIFIPCAGWVSDRLGNKRVFLIALGLFTAASAAMRPGPDTHRAGRVSIHPRSWWRRAHGCRDGAAL